MSLKFKPKKSSSFSEQLNHHQQPIIPVNPHPLKTPKNPQRSSPLLTDLKIAPPDPKISKNQQIMVPSLDGQLLVKDEICFIEKLFLFKGYCFEGFLLISCHL
jgi:hypothetical protein